MNILAVDTAGKTLGVALLQDDRLKYECYLDGGMTHSETLMPLVDHCLKLCGLTCADIDLFGVNAGPGSFTGEDCAEFHCHGSPVVLREVLTALFAAGARQAGPGEFTKRAYLNGKMSLTQAESVADIIGRQRRFTNFSNMIARWEDTLEGRGKALALLTFMTVIVGAVKIAVPLLLMEL